MGRLGGNKKTGRGLVRGTDNTAPKTGLPVHLTIKDGRGQIVRQQTLNTNAAGVFTHTLELADHSNTGTWTADWHVKGGNKSEYLGEQRSSFRNFCDGAHISLKAPGP